MSFPKPVSTIGEVLDEWETRIRLDLTPFADPGTALDVLTEGRTIRARWIMRSEGCEAVFGISVDSGVSVRFRGNDLTYKGFFAASEMADLAGLAKMILQASPRSIFVETPAIPADAEEAAPQSATKLLDEMLTSAQEVPATAVIIVTGDAGAGKTSVLQELVKQSAAKFLSGKADKVLLYVNAQGRALARLEEALATELNDLRARLTYHAVPTLTRLGILVPVIDGFDELLGVSGYDEAFSSLSRFVEDLNGDGQIIASARSTYYEQEFVARANTVSSLGSQIWHQIPVRVLEWGSSEVGQYFDQRIARDGLQDLQVDLRAAFDKAFRGDNAALKTKPFFVSRVLGLVIDGISFDHGGDLLDALVTAYADREVQKLRGRSGEELLSRDQIVELLEEIAEEMWNQESRELDKRSARDVAEFMLGTHGISESTQRYVIERMPSMAFLTPGTRPNSVAFEHESFFAHFLGERLAERLSSEPIRLHALLGRSAMPDEVAESAAATASEHLTEAEARSVLSLLSTAAAIESSRTRQVQDNSGLLAVALLRSWCATHGTLSGGTLQNVVIPGSSFAGVELTDFRFADVEMRRVDLCNARFLGNTYDRGLLLEVAVDPRTTVMEFRNFDPATQLLGLRLFAGETAAPIFDPVRIRDVLVQCGMKHLAGNEVAIYDVREDVVDMLERIVRAYMRANPISVNEEEPSLNVLLRHTDWSRVEEVLIESGVVRPESKSTSGTKKTFLRRQVRAEEIMAGLDPKAAVPEAVRKLWTRLAAEFPGD